MKLSALDQQGISNLIAALILIAVVIIGGSFVFSSFYSQMQTITKNPSLQRKSLDLVSTSSGDLASVTIKNDGTVALENVRVKIVNPRGDNVELSIDRLAPGQTGSDFEQGDWGIMPGNTYPVLIRAKGPRGENIITRATIARSVG